MLHYVAFIKLSAEKRERETVLEKELCSPMISAVCSISLISPIGVASLLHAADQFPLHNFQSASLCVRMWAVCLHPR